MKFCPKAELIAAPILRRTAAPPRPPRRSSPHGDDNTRYDVHYAACDATRHDATLRNAPRRAGTSRETPGPELLLRANNALVTGLRIMQILRRGPGDGEKRIWTGGGWHGAGRCGGYFHTCVTSQGRAHPAPPRRAAPCRAARILCRCVDAVCSVPCCGDAGMLGCRPAGKLQAGPLDQGAGHCALSTAQTEDSPRGRAHIT